MSVVDVKIIRQFAYANWRSFGNTGQYEQIDALMTFAVDPNAKQNGRIVDLEYAPVMPKDEFDLPLTSRSLNRWIPNVDPRGCSSNFPIEAGVE